MPESEDRPAWVMVLFVFICLAAASAWIILKQNGML